MQHKGQEIYVCFVCVLWSVTNEETNAKVILRINVYKSHVCSYNVFNILNRSQSLNTRMMPSVQTK